MNHKSLYYIVGLWFYLNNKMLGFFFRLYNILYSRKLNSYILCTFLEDDCSYVEVDVPAKIYTLKHLILKHISGLRVRHQRLYNYTFFRLKIGFPEILFIQVVFFWTFFFRLIKLVFLFDILYVMCIYYFSIKYV